MSKAAQLAATRPSIMAMAEHALATAHNPGRSAMVMLRVSYPSPEWMEALNPHAKGRWQSKAPGTKWLRAEVANRVGMVWAYKQMERASVTYRFFWPRNGTGDEGNMIQRMKPAIDGMKDAGVIVDDNWSRLSTKAVESVKDAENPRIEIVIGRKD